MNACMAVLLLGLASQAHVTPATPNNTDADPQTYTGFVSDSRCGRNVDVECNKKCFNEGTPAVLVLDAGGDILSVKDDSELKKYPGSHVSVTGVRSGSVLEIKSVTPLKK